ncbi:hypothetical protein K1719_045291 [Acacia pycnantha]|nr:hypothetical protein K1719_045291 [Acacia pycnantha]
MRRNLILRKSASDPNGSSLVAFPASTVCLALLNPAACSISSSLSRSCLLFSLAQLAAIAKHNGGDLHLNRRILLRSFLLVSALRLAAFFSDVVP